MSNKKQILALHINNEFECGSQYENCSKKRAWIDGWMHETVWMKN